MASARSQKLVLTIVAVFSSAVILAVSSVFVLGARLPKDHEVRVSKTVPGTPAAVFATLDDVASQKEWFPGVSAVEKLDDVPARERWREHLGKNSFVLETVEKKAPTVLERTITDDHGPFTGSWRFEIADDGAGTRVTLIERGHVESIPGRFFLHYATGPEKYAQGYLDALATRMRAVGAPGPLSPAPMDADRRAPSAAPMK
jgi:hypothetical protein